MRRSARDSFEKVRQTSDYSFKKMRDPSSIANSRRTPDGGLMRIGSSLFLYYEKLAIHLIIVVLLRGTILEIRREDNCDKKSCSQAGNFR